MFEIVIALTIASALIYGLRAGMISQDGSIVPPRVDADSLRIGILAALLALALLDFPYGLSLVAAVILHEAGHVLAYRLLGHGDARFRLLPMISKDPISTRKPATLQAEVFVHLMGAAFSIAPMVVALVAAGLLQDHAPAVARFLRILGSVIAAYNFINLLPLWPLDGGRCVNAIAHSLRANARHRAMVGLSAIASALAIGFQSPQLLVICMIGSGVFLFPEHLEIKQTAMPRRALALAAATYLAITATHLAGGAWLIEWFFF
ncbi:hypothetical protein E7811_15565 [Aliigemmobacter aestuarii]|uniref:Metalloprotease n=1 Tax=Aliigemmobacter aestuarii TaxID=1445661 RepID=A0A4V3V069_9RHOB|nr:hypothetical protein [Gemmobacter aestuarii]THD82458.1 hypothetical protein E7811_15565 [Gemmobacter aestuarii]